MHDAEKHEADAIAFADVAVVMVQVEAGYKPRGDGKLGGWALSGNAREEVWLMRTVMMPKSVSSPKVTADAVSNSRFCERKDTHWDALCGYDRRWP